MHVIIESLTYFFNAPSEARTSFIFRLLQQQKQQHIMTTHVAPSLPKCLRETSISFISHPEAEKVLLRCTGRDIEQYFESRGAARISVRFALTLFTLATQIPTQLRVYFHLFDFPHAESCLWIFSMEKPICFSKLCIF